MNSFQILDKEGIAININDLDREAAEFWGKPVYSPYGSNWFDLIGYNIANQGNYTSGWDNVVVSMQNANLQALLINTKNKEKIEIIDNESIMDRIENIKAYYQPFIDLINYWISKGYQPKQIKE